MNRQNVRKKTKKVIKLDLIRKKVKQKKSH